MTRGLLQSRTNCTSNSGQAPEMRNCYHEVGTGYFIDSHQAATNTLVHLSRSFILRATKKTCLISFLKKHGAVISPNNQSPFINSHYHHHIHASNYKSSFSQKNKLRDKSNLTEKCVYE